jgi:tetratricopeptide (TPR) repeat protein
MQELIEPVVARWEPGSFRHCLALSRHYRVTAMPPILTHEWHLVAAEMKHCERHGRRCAEIAATGQERLFARDTLHSVFESRMREKLQQGDVAGGLPYARENYGTDPHDSLVVFEYAEALARAGELEEAAEMFAEAARCGPPGTAAALAIRGWCLEQADQPEAAIQSYEDSLAIEPDGVSSTLALAHAAARVGDEDARARAARNAERLAQGGALTADQRAALAESLAEVPA